MFAVVMVRVGYDGPVYTQQVSKVCKKAREE
jgi:hypothetical protein